MRNSGCHFFFGFLIGLIGGATYALFKAPRIVLRQPKKEGVISLLPANTVKESIQAGKNLARERLKSR